MTFDQAFEIADAAVLAQTGKHLTNLERDILQGVWDGLRYSQMAQAFHRSESHYEMVELHSGKSYRLLSMKT